MTKQQLLSKTAQDAAWAAGMLPTVVRQGADVRATVPTIRLVDLFFGATLPMGLEVFEHDFVNEASVRLYGWTGTAREDQLTGDPADVSTTVHGPITIRHHSTTPFYFWHD